MESVACFFFYGVTRMGSSADAVSLDNSDVPTVLVIEDDLDNQLLLKYTLNMFEYRSIIVSDGEMGLYLAKKHQPDIILLDIVLAKTSGLKLAFLFKSEKATQNIPIIAVTALVRKQEKELIYSSGCDGYLSKPYLLDDLKSIIELQLKIAKSCKFYRNNFRYSFGF